MLRDFPGGSDSKESACNVGDPGLIPGSGRCPGEVYPLQYTSLENFMDRGIWRAKIHGVIESDMTEVTENALLLRKILKFVDL